jgi:hypothetical protein
MNGGARALPAPVVGLNVTKRSFAFRRDLKVFRGELLETRNLINSTYVPLRGGNGTVSLSGLGKIEFSERLMGSPELVERVNAVAGMAREMVARHDNFVRATNRVIKRLANVAWGGVAVMAAAAVMWGVGVLGTVVGLSGLALGAITTVAFVIRQVVIKSIGISYGKNRQFEGNVHKLANSESTVEAAALISKVF